MQLLPLLWYRDETIKTVGVNTWVSGRCLVGMESRECL